MREQDYTQELFADFFKEHIVGYAIANGDVVISDDKEAFEALVKNYKKNGYNVKFGNLVEAGIGEFSRNGELHSDLVNAVSFSQQIYGQGSNVKETKTYVASNNVQSIKNAVEVVIDRYATTAGKAFSRSEVALVTGILEVKTSINNKELDKVKVYSDAEANNKEEIIFKIIDAAVNEDAGEM